jgi:hypothetical protein
MGAEDQLAGDEIQYDDILATMDQTWPGARAVRGKRGRRI